MIFEAFDKTASGGQSQEEDVTTCDVLHSDPAVPVQSKKKIQ
jgi:hypothetical protein